MIWYARVFRKYFTFSGRSSKLEYMMFNMFNLLVLALLLLTDFIISLFVTALPYGIVTAIYLLAFITPFFSATTRRMHDSGKGKWQFIFLFIPVINMIWIVDLILSDGEPYRNMHGYELREE
jgi:uncharacterized membrane protein YhaH (DUF805 family)